MEASRLPLTRGFRFLLAAVLVSALPVSAQEQAATPQSPQPAPETSPAAPESADPAQQPTVDPETADISITATVRAREVRFETEPQVRVEFFGQPERITEDKTERTNLPEKVQPGVTYRDIGIRLKIVSVFADIDRIVAEALGEVPPASVQPPALAPEAPATPPADTPEKRP